MVAQRRPLRRRRRPHLSPPNCTFLTIIRLLTLQHLTYHPLSAMVMNNAMSNGESSVSSSPTTCPLPPHSGYHGGTALPGRPFFEGWYLRVVPRILMPADDGPNSGADKEWEGPMAFIHHVFDPHLPLSKRRGVGTQALTPLGFVYKE
eukprot:13197609-Ditylum_brightwellii.AAC.1